MIELTSEQLWTGRTLIPLLYLLIIGLYVWLVRTSGWSLRDWARPENVPSKPNQRIRLLVAVLLTVPLSVSADLQYLLVRVWSLDEPAAGILYQLGVSAYWYFIQVEGSYPLAPEDPVPAQPTDWRLTAMLVVLALLGVIGIYLVAFPM